MMATQFDVTAFYKFLLVPLFSGLVSEGMFDKEWLIKVNGSFFVPDGIYYIYNSPRVGVVVVVLTLF